VLIMGSSTIRTAYSARLGLSSLCHDGERNVERSKKTVASRCFSSIFLKQTPPNPPVCPSAVEGGGLIGNRLAWGQVIAFA